MLLGTLRVCLRECVSIDSCSDLSMKCGFAWVSLSVITLRCMCMDYIIERGLIMTRVLTLHVLDLFCLL